MLGSLAGIAGGLYHLYKFGKKAHDAYNTFSGTHLGKMVNSGVKSAGARAGSALKSVGSKVGSALKTGVSTLGSVAKDFGKNALSTAVDRLKTGDLSGATNLGSLAMEAAYKTLANRGKSVPKPVANAAAPTPKKQKQTLLTDYQGYRPSRHVW